MLLAVSERKMEETFEREDVIRDKCNVIGLANSRNSEVIVTSATKIYTKMTILSILELDVVENFIELTGVLSSLLHAPLIMDRSHILAIPLTNSFPMPQALVNH